MPNGRALVRAAPRRSAEVANEGDHGIAVSGLGDDQVKSPIPCISETGILSEILQQSQRVTYRLHVQLGPFARRHRGDFAFHDAAGTKNIARMVIGAKGSRWPEILGAGDENAPSVARLDLALDLEQDQRFPDGWPRNAEPLRQLALRWQPLPRFECAGCDP
jgi:hypothetical protein